MSQIILHIIDLKFHMQTKCLEFLSDLLRYPFFFCIRYFCSYKGICKESMQKSFFTQTHKSPENTFYLSCLDFSVGYMWKKFIPLLGFNQRKSFILESARLKCQHCSWSWAVWPSKFWNEFCPKI